MVLKRLKTPLRDALTSRAYEHTLQRASAREPMLAQHPSIFSLLAAMNDESFRGYPERDALTRAMLRELQRGDRSYWSSVLLLSYAPMLLRLRGRIFTDDLTRDDLDQLVVETFLETIATFPLEARTDRTAMYVRQDTQRSFFRKLAAIRKERITWVEFDEEELAEAAYETWEQPREGSDLDDEERAELAVMLRELVGDAIPESKLDVIIATRLRGESLRDIVACDSVGQPESHCAAAYQRAKRERTRTLGKLRRIFDAAMSPREDLDALPSRDVAAGVPGERDDHRRRAGDAARGLP